MTFKDVFMEKWMPVIISGIILSSLGHLYWQKQKEMENRQLIINNKIQTYVNTSKLLTDIKNNIDKIADLQKDSTIKFTDPRIQELIKKDDSIASELGANFAYAKLFFRGETTNKLYEFKSLYYKVMTDFMEHKKLVSVDKNSLFYNTTMAVLDSMSDEIKNNLSK